MSNRFNQYESMDLTGKKYGALTCLERIKGTAKIYARWKCQCVCGNIRFVETRKLPRTYSCGCLNKKKGVKSSANTVDNYFVYEDFDY